MPSTAQLIKRHLSGLQQGAIFCTRELLGYGERNTVDNMLSRLVKCGRITRLARGVFSNSRYKPSAITCWHIIEAKMKAWGKAYWTPYTKPEQEREVIPFTSQPITVYVSGSSSSFLTTDGVRCHLVHNGPRKMKLGNSPAGVFARKLWNTGKESFSTQKIDTLLLGFIGPNLTELLCSFRLLPAWINDALQNRRVQRFGVSLSEVCRLGKESNYCHLEAKLRHC